MDSVWDIFRLGRLLRSCLEFAQNTSDYIRISTEDARIDTPRFVTLCQNLLDFSRMASSNWHNPTTYSDFSKLLADRANDIILTYSDMLWQTLTHSRVYTGYIVYSRKSIPLLT